MSDLRWSLDTGRRSFKKTMRSTSMYSRRLCSVTVSPFRAESLDQSLSATQMLCPIVELIMNWSWTVVCNWWNKLKQSCSCSSRSYGCSSPGKAATASHINRIRGIEQNLHHTAILHHDFSSQVSKHRDTKSKLILLLLTICVMALAVLETFHPVGDDTLPTFDFSPQHVARLPEGKLDSLFRLWRQMENC